VFVVAITRLATPVEQEVPLLAAELAVLPYDLRMTIAAGLPAVIFTTAERERALAVLGKLRGRGHDAVACDDTFVVAGGTMVALRRFRLDADAVVVDVPPSGEERLPYHDVLAGLRAVHRTTSETTSEVTEKKFAVGRALASGGLVMRKKSTHEVTSTQEGREQVMYLFRRSGGRPWLLVESQANYSSLGPHLARTKGENFLKTIELLKGLCPHARFDDSLLSARKTPEVTRNAGAKSSESSSASGVDLLAHLLALSISRG
jgi:hypothetical protein